MGDGLVLVFDIYLYGFIAFLLCSSKKRSFLKGFIKGRNFSLLSKSVKNILMSCLVDLIHLLFYIYINSV